MLLAVVLYTFSYLIKPGSGDRHFLCSWRVGYNGARLIVEFDYPDVVRERMKLLRLYRRNWLRRYTIHPTSRLNHLDWWF